jgi:hypothetical protein
VPYSDEVLFLLVGEGFRQNVKLLSKTFFMWTSVMWSNFSSAHFKIKASSIVGI